MINRRLDELLVLIPHASTKRPTEIKKKVLSKHQKRLLFGNEAETDRGTDHLYDFRSILGNKQIVFPVSQVYINVLRSPKRLDSSVPLYIGNTPIYKKGSEISSALRRKLIKKYYNPFYVGIRSARPRLIFDGHSTIKDHFSLKDTKLDYDITIVDYLGEKNGKKIWSTPREYLEVYARALQKRLPELKVGVNNLYCDVYDHVCATFSRIKRKKNFIPIISQETDEELYIEKNKINTRKVKHLRIAFAEALRETMAHLGLIGGEKFQSIH